MGVGWRSALFFCLLMVSSSLANEEATHETTAGHGVSGTGNVTADTGGHEDGHESAPIKTLPIVTWKWHHVSAPYLVTLWILVSWICKLSES